MDLVPRGRFWKSKADFLRPFRAGASEAGETIVPLYDPNIPRDETREPNLRELNSALRALVDIFPDVQPEVFRAMLLAVNPDSRLAVVTEHLMNKKAKWVRGKYRTSSGSSSNIILRPASNTLSIDRGSLENEDLFRSAAYQRAVKQIFYQEFRNLSHSTIKGVLAEQNFSYTRSRPILQQVSSKSWRFSLISLWSKRSPSNAVDDHPFVVWQADGTLQEPAVPAIRRTGNSDLDQELFELFVNPVITARRQDRLLSDHQTANQLNEAEAEAAEALYDCDCCYSSVTFERISSCDESCHFLCLDCIRRTVNEALYGQGWSRTADLQRASVRCFSPTSQGCTGTLPSSSVQRALVDGSGNKDVWHEFQARISTDTLQKCGMPLQRCPFCSYAEVDEGPEVKMKHPMALCVYIATKTSARFQMFSLLFCASLCIFTLPLLALASFLWLLARLLPSAEKALSSSVSRVHKQRRGLRFRCQSPTCMKASCTRCMASWQDPHACFESEKTSLRTAIEASATAAVKRTCPKCMLSFVKASGCNKLVCNCGYTMCYICRQEITSKEGYAHFCQHFRPNGGRCMDCERCDLYGDEDEDSAIQRAAETAEMAWREQEVGKEGDARANKLLIDALIHSKQPTWHEELLDTLVDALIR